MFKNRILLIMLTAMLVLGMAACGGKPATETEEPATDEPATGETATEETAVFTWNGQKEVWAVVPTTNAEGLMMICDAMGAACEADGWTYVKKDAEGNPGNQVTYVEDAIAAGNVGALMVAAMSTEMLHDIVIEANEAGLIVVYLGAEPVDYAIASEVYTAYEITGMWAIEAAEAWAAQNANIKKDSQGVPVALDVYYDIQDGAWRSNAFVERTEESDSLYVFNTNSTYGDNAQTEGYNWAENQMTANPDLRVFICYEPDSAYGVCAYLDVYAKENGLDLADFCVINCYEDGDTPGYLEKANADPSSTAFKGYVTYGSEGGPPVIGAKLAEEILGVANGTWEWGTYFYDDINAYTSFGFAKTWTMGDENPAQKYKH